MSEIAEAIKIEVPESKNIKSILDKQKSFFSSGISLKIDYRKDALRKLLKVIEEMEKEIEDALWADFRKPAFETFATETGLVKSEIRHALSGISKWSRPQFKGLSLASYPGRLFLEHQPYGNTLIVAPWNYPFQLVMSPLVGAISAGNTAIVKPSELAPHTSKLVETIIGKTFDPGHVCVVNGDLEVSKALLEEKYDFIFFTGSTGVGRIIYRKAAERLTPCVLELGGKSPCIVNKDADLETASKRITWGKFLNGGQTCVAPDYLIVHESVKKNLVELIQKDLRRFYGKEISESPDYPRIINEKHFNRLSGYLEGQNVILGGKVDKNDLYIAPTLLDTPSMESAVMKEEIFGPILPILSFSTILEAEEILHRNPKPLALYIFSRDKAFIREINQNHISGDVCINDVVSHFGEKKIGVGGVGESGIGKYHGKYSFEIFSHQKSVLKRRLWPDLPLRYPPYKNKIGLLKMLLNRI